MNYSFECKTCGACGCGVSLYNEERKQVSKSHFLKHPENLYCVAHVPDKSPKKKAYD